MSDDPKDQEAGLPPSGEPSDSGAPAAEEVEYVYQDENGNPIAAPEGELDSSEYEAVEVEVPADAAAAPAEAPASSAAETIPTMPPASRTTQKLSKPISSSRRSAEERKSARQSKPMTPEELKKVRTKVFLLLGLLALIPILGLALIAMLWHKGRLGNPTTRKVYRENAYDRSVNITKVTDERYNRADSLFHENKRSEAKREYQQCLNEFNEALGELETFIKEHPGEEYTQVEALARQIRMKRGQVQARLVMMEKD